MADMFLIPISSWQIHSWFQCVADYCETIYKDHSIESFKIQLWPGKIVVSLLYLVQWKRRQMISRLSMVWILLVEDNYRKWLNLILESEPHNHHQPELIASFTSFVISYSCGLCSRLLATCCSKWNYTATHEERKKEAELCACDLKATSERDCSRNIFGNLLISS